MKNTLSWAVRVLWHSLPLYPLLFQRYALAVAALLLVGLSYIKVFKFRQQLNDFPSAGDSNQKLSINRAMLRWKQLTFL